MQNPLISNIIIGIDVKNYLDTGFLRIGIYKYIVAHSGKKEIKSANHNIIACNFYIICIYIYTIPLYI